MPPEPAPSKTETDTRAFQVSRHLMEFIRHERLKPGDAVPSEMQLCRELNVSRSVVREAYRTLSASGVIEISNGKTPKVSRIDSLPVSALMRHALYTGQVTPLQIVELRSALDVQAAKLAAKRATPEHLAALQGAIDTMRQAGPVGGAYIRHDVHFHALLAEASGNPLISLQVTALSKAARHSIRAGRNAEPNGVAFAALLTRHQVLLDAVRSGDEQAAAAASQTHFASAQAALSESVS
ncbi:FadR/GntR family transcriptional regulator [Deinococcus sp.]|uniref:FadR/GntR family transcriptional regulator n=1 Tax=Deinococcus sp. TaxID=47478 RepID=UPI003B5C6910